MKKLFTILTIVFCFNLNAQIITTVAGNGTSNDSGDGGAASLAGLSFPKAVLADGAGNLYFSEFSGRIRKINTAGIISTIAGVGTSGYSGDGGQATNAKLNEPWGLALDGSGNLYVADFINSVVRKIDAAGIITTVAGNGTGGFTGDGGQATNAQISGPTSIAFDGIGNMFIGGYGGNNECVIRKVNTAGIITTFAGNGSTYGEGGQATAAAFLTPVGLAFDTGGNLFICDQSCSVVRKVNAAGIISTVAGNHTSVCGIEGYSGDGGQATDAYLNPQGISFDGAGNLCIADGVNNVIRKVNTAGVISTFIGNGFGAGNAQGGNYSGDGGLASAAELNTANGITFDQVGNMYISDYFNQRIRKVSPPLIVNVNSDTICTGTLTTLTASGAANYTWSPSIGLNTNIGNTVIANPTVTTTYTITGAHGDSIGITISVITVLNSTPTLSLTSNTYTTCNGSSIPFSVSGAASYTWSPALSLLNSNSANPIASPTTATIYTVNGTNACGIGSALTLTVNIISAPTLTTSASSYTICAGLLDTLMVNGANTYSWLPTSSLTNDTGNVVVANPTSSTIYSVTSTIGSCITTNTLNITVLPNASIPQPTDSNLVYCQGNSYPPISASGTGIILWSMNSSMIPIINSGNIYTPTNLPIGTTVYYLTDSLGTSGCVNPFTSSITILVDPAPSVSIQLVQDPTPHVWDLYVNYSANVIDATWYWGDGTNTPGLYPYHVYDSAGAYNICVTVFNTCGDSANFCQNDSIYRLAYNTVSSSLVQANVLPNTTGINQLSATDNKVIIYPNPNKGTFTIETTNTDKQTLQVFDVNGKLVLSQFINGNTNIDATNLSEGVYNINLISLAGVVNKKLVIVR